MPNDTAGTVASDKCARKLILIPMEVGPGIMTLLKHAKALEPVAFKYLEAYDHGFLQCVW